MFLTLLLNALPPVFWYAVIVPLDAAWRSPHSPSPTLYGRTSEEKLVTVDLFRKGRPYSVACRCGASLEHVAKAQAKLLDGSYEYVFSNNEGFFDNNGIPQDKRAR